MRRSVCTTLGLLVVLLRLGDAECGCAAHNRWFQGIASVLASSDGNAPGGDHHHHAPQEEPHHHDDGPADHHGECECEACPVFVRTAPRLDPPADEFAFVGSSYSTTVMHVGEAATAIRVVPAAPPPPPASAVLQL